jgi:protocatechuate 3,4-dioxygenase beta subunit
MKTGHITRRTLIATAPALLLPASGLAKIAPTPGASEGPFYPRRLPSDDDNDLIRVEGADREAAGDILHLTGRVLDRNENAIAGARVEIWQCDANGVYHHQGDRRRDQRDNAFQGFGHALGDNTGQFSFRTIVPVPYPGRTPHIHVKVIWNNRHLLTSQLYLRGHPHNPGDFLFSRLNEAEQNQVSMDLKRRQESGRSAFDTSIDLVLPA